MKAPNATKAGEPSVVQATRRRSRSRPRRRSRRRRGPRARGPGSPFDSGRPWSSSSACAPIPRARKNAASPAPSRPAASPARARRRSRRSSGARACTAGGGASRSRASRPGGARRTPASCLAAPDHDPAAEAHRPVPDVLDARPRPTARAAARAGAPPEPLDARAEEVARLGPAGRDQPAETGQADADVQAPHARRATGSVGIANSSEATVAPGRTTRASSRSVRPGSST